jgi:hypothetical protein
VVHGGFYKHHIFWAGDGTHKQKSKICNGNAQLRKPKESPISKSELGIMLISSLQHINHSTNPEQIIYANSIMSYLSSGMCRRVDLV